jgi:hypothetical protein
MMERYFDAFLYLANGGTRQPMFRLPRGVLDRASERYCHTDADFLREAMGVLLVRG